MMFIYRNSLSTGKHKALEVLNLFFLYHLALGLCCLQHQVIHHSEPWFIYMVIDRIIEGLGVISDQLVYIHGFQWKLFFSPLNCPFVFHYKYIVIWPFRASWYFWRFFRRNNYEDIVINFNYAVSIIHEIAWHLYSFKFFCCGKHTYKKS